jgi:hypothetical protein
MFGEAVGGFVETDSSHRSNGLQYHFFVTRSDTEFKFSLRDSRVPEDPHVIGPESD